VTSCGKYVTNGGGALAAAGAGFIDGRSTF
jgi:hypothetical protein